MNENFLFFLPGSVVVIFAMMIASRLIRFFIASYLRHHRLRFWATIAMVSGSVCIAGCVFLVYSGILFILMELTDEMGRITGNWELMDNIFYALAVVAAPCSVAAVAKIYEFVPKGKKRLQWLKSISIIDHADQKNQAQSDG